MRTVRIRPSAAPALFAGNLVWYSSTFDFEACRRQCVKQPKPVVDFGTNNGRFATLSPDVRRAAELMHLPRNGDTATFFGEFAT